MGELSEEEEVVRLERGGARELSFNMNSVSCPIQLSGDTKKHTCATSARNELGQKIQSVLAAAGLIHQELGRISEP